MGAGLPAGALNVVTGSDVSLGAKVAQSPSISYVTYSGNKQVCEKIDVIFLTRKLTASLYICSKASRCFYCYQHFLNHYNNVSLLFQDGVMLCKATAGMGVPVSVSPIIGATCPFIIFESADIDSAVDEVIETAFKKKTEVIYVEKCPL